MSEILVNSSIGISSFDIHVSEIFSESFEQLFKFRQVRKTLSEDAFQDSVHTFVYCYLDYRNSLLHGIHSNLINKLQRVAARLVTLTRSGSFLYLIRPPLAFTFLQNLYNVILLVFKALNGIAPNYLSCLLSKRAGLKYQMHSDSSIHASFRHFHTSFGESASTVAGLRLLNSPPTDLRSCFYISIFKSKLKDLTFSDMLLLYSFLLLLFLSQKVSICLQSEYSTFFV